jgi:hypothetical protein
MVDVDYYSHCTDGKTEAQNPLIGQGHALVPQRAGRSTSSLNTDLRRMKCLSTHPSPEIPDLFLLPYRSMVIELLAGLPVY